MSTNNTNDKILENAFVIPPHLSTLNAGFTMANDPISGKLVETLMLAHYAGILWKNIQKKKTP